MKKIMIYAYTRINLGDDLLIKTLCDRYPQTRFILYAPSIYKKILSDCDNLVIYSNNNIIAKCINFLGRLFCRPNLFENLLARQCDACVCITGSLFIQKTENWTEYYKYCVDRKIDTKPYFLIGANFGPFTDINYFKSFKTLFQTYTDICFREQFSKDLFSSLDNVRFAPDAVFTSLDIVSNAKRNNINKKIIAISVIDLSNRLSLSNYEDLYLSAIKKLCYDYIGKGYKIKLISFCAAEGDEHACTKLKNELCSTNISVQFYQGDIRNLIETLNASEVIVATRFHAMIIGWLLQKKVLPLCYSSKSVNVLSDIGYPLPYLEICNFRKDTDLSKLIENITNVFDIKEIINKSHMQFMKLDKFINS